jgi:two-component system LytT family response regulator
MSNEYTCIIIDDEPYVIELLAESIKGLYDNIKIIGTYSSWKDASHAMRNNNADILFLDISIEGKNGMDLLKLAPQSNAELIFVTAFSEYALNAFKHAATGYLLKPIDDIELTAAVDIAIERIKNKRLALNQNNITNVSSINSKIGIPNNKGIEYLTINDILFLEAENTYTKVVLKNEELLSSYNIGKFKDLLDNNMFYQVHRSYLVNLNCIRRYENNGTIVMDNNAIIPVSRNIREDFLKLFVRVKSEDIKKP